MTEAILPVLYSFRRCPYAMRARVALAYAGIKLEMREILLKDKPPEMIALSGKGTVPVLQLPDGSVIDESIDVVRWALGQNDPDGWLEPQPELTDALIEENDGSFKTALDKYKYHTRFPEHPPEHYREQGEQFFLKLEGLLEANQGGGLVRDTAALADMAIFPFVRQFANADKPWFSSAPYPLLQAWLARHLQATYFLRVMHKYPLWLEGRNVLVENWDVATSE